jgi:ribosomal protein S18 acetylase RimI-like enzyme
VEYRRNPPLTADDLRGIFEASGLVRPVDDAARLDRMARNANLVYGAFDGERMVGLLRALTDFAFCCYVSDLGVARAYQGRGIGSEMLRRLREELGDEVMVLLLSAPPAREFYPKVGFERVENAYKVPRAR